MRRLLYFVLVVIGVSAQTLVPAPQAQAVGETLTCIVSPMINPVFNNNCRSHKPSTSYTAKFKVSHGPGTYSFNWSYIVSWQTNGSPVVAGCTPSSDYCWISVPSDDCGDKLVTATVSIILNGQEGVLSSSAHVYATCWLGTMLTWC